MHRYILYQNFMMFPLVLLPPPLSFEAVYCFICSRRRVAVARYRMILWRCSANVAFVDQFADCVQVNNKDQFVLFLNIKVSSPTNVFAKWICFLFSLCRQWPLCPNMTVNCSQVLDNGTYYELLCASSTICCTGSVNTCSSSACSENSVAVSESSELPVL